MTVRVDKRFSSGMSVLFAYTAAKAIDNASSAVSFLGAISGTHLDFYNRGWSDRCRRSTSPSGP